MKNDNIKNQYRVNEQIRVREVRIVGDGESMVVPTRQALDMARDQGVDLVEISPNANPPVCRLIDYSKFLYLLHFICFFSRVESKPVLSSKPAKRWALFGKWK